MSRFSQFAGIVGLVVFVFGLLTFLLLYGEGGLFTFIHLVLGAGLLLFFAAKGGLLLIGTAAVKRAAGYSAGVTVYSALFLGILVLANYFFQRHDPLYFDSTEQNVYTLAPQTTKVLDSLDNKVVIRAFFVGGEVPADIEGLLDRVERASPNISWEVVDPEKSPRLTEKFGISERDTLHFSFAEEGSTREAKVVRDIDEQAVTNAILKLTRGGEKKLYYIQGHGESNLDDQTEAGYLFLKEAIQGENISVAPLELSAAGAVPDDADAVLLLAPRRNLLSAEHEKLQKYLAGGGNAVMAVEPNTVDDVHRLAAPLGIEVGRDIVLDQVLRLFEGRGVGVQPVVARYGKHPIVEGFSQNTVYSTLSSVRAAAEPPAGEGAVAELAFTGENSWATTDVDTIFGEDPVVEMPAEDERAGGVPVAAAFEGTAVFDGLEQEEGTEQPVSRVVVFGDADFVANVNIRQLFNRDFFLNALNWAVGEQERVSIRARTLRASTETLTDNQFRAIFLAGGVLIPELMVLLGLAIWWFRRS